MAINFTGPNKWQRVYFEVKNGEPDNRRIKAPLIEPFEIPLLFSQHILAVTATCITAKPRWRTAGYLKQVYSGVSLESSSTVFTVNSPTSGVDAASKRIGLNTLELVIFPQLASDFYLWFDPVYWLPKLTLGIWQFTGEVSPDRLEELIETLKVDVVRVESKIDALNY